MATFRYRPADNRTPVQDPIFGHLSWDGIYDDPRCADDPRFELIESSKAKPRKAKPRKGKNVSAPAGDRQATSTKPSAKPAGASKPGRS